MRTAISANHFSSAASQIDPLRCRTAASGFRGVYFAKKSKAGVDVYVARVKRHGVLRTLPGSRSPEPRVCARHLAAWYAAVYGDGWPDVLAARKRTPWAVVPEGDWFRACVWIGGAREWVMVTEKGRRNAWRVTGRVAAFPTREAAREGIHQYLARAYGLLWTILLHRRGAA